MAHSADEKRKLLNRVRRIRGQVEAIERELNDEAECSAVLHTTYRPAAVRWTPLWPKLLKDTFVFI